MVSALVCLSDLLISLTGELLSFVRLSGCTQGGGVKKKRGGERAVTSADGACFLSPVSGR